MKLKNFIGIAWFMVATVGCVAKEKVPLDALGISHESSCTADTGYPPSSSWSLDDPYSASLINRSDGLTIICVYKGGLAVFESTPIKLEAEEFVASQTCSYRDKASTSIFGVGIRSEQEVDLRLAWNFNKTTQILELVDVDQVRCIYSDMDE